MKSGDPDPTEPVGCKELNHGDHNTPRADGGSDLKENANAFCSFCHWVKTVIFNDGRKKIFLEDV